MKKALLYTLAPLGFLFTACDSAIPSTLKDVGNKEFWVNSVKAQIDADSTDTAQYIVHAMDIGELQITKAEELSNASLARTDRELRGVFIDPVNQDTLANVYFSETVASFDERHIRQTGETGFLTSSIHITAAHPDNDATSVFNMTETYWQGNDPTTSRDVNIFTEPKMR